MDFRALAVGLAFPLPRSSAFATERVIVAATPPLWGLTFRFALSGLIAVVLARLLGRDWRWDLPRWC